MGPLSPVRVPLGRSVPYKADKLRFTGGEGGGEGRRQDTVTPQLTAVLLISI